MFVVVIPAKEHMRGITLFNLCCSFHRAREKPPRDARNETDYFVGNHLSHMFVGANLGDAKA